jgi:hypothetical protein
VTGQFPKWSAHGGANPYLVVVESGGQRAIACQPPIFRAPFGVQQVVEKRHERRPDKAKSDQKAQFMCNKNEHFPQGRAVKGLCGPARNTVWPCAIVF